MKIKFIALAAVLLFTAWLCPPAQAKGPARFQRPLGGACFCPAPRFQMYWAPGNYGGLIMVDNKTGRTYQRVLVNSRGGITVKWLPIPVMKSGPAPGESILWNTK